MARDAGGGRHGVVRFIQSDGLDRAHQRQIDDLKEQEQRLRQPQAIRPVSAARS